DWIEDPLIDPDRFNQQLELIQVEVSGLQRDSRLVLSRPNEAGIGMALAGPDGVARMQFAWLPGSPAPKANVQLIGRQRSARARQTAGGGGLSRQRLER